MLAMELYESQYNKLKEERDEAKESRGDDDEAETEYQALVNEVKAARKKKFVLKDMQSDPPVKPIYPSKKQKKSHEIEKTTNVNDDGRAKSLKLKQSSLHINIILRYIM